MRAKTENVILGSQLEYLIYFLLLFMQNKYYKRIGLRWKVVVFLSLGNFL